MADYAAVLEAKTRYKELQENVYTGRGLIVGMDKTEQYLVLATWLTGRSDPSRNRFYVKDRQGSVRVEVIDPSKVDPEQLQWIRYRAMAETTGIFVISNGDQTETVLEDFAETRSLGEQYRFYDSMLKRRYEEDSINTPRISAVCHSAGASDPYAEISLLRKGPKHLCQRSHFSYEDLLVGYGYCIHTYETDGEPPPDFTGEPYLLPLEGDSIEEMANYLWEALHPTNRVALALKWVSQDNWRSTIHLINTQQPGE